MANRRKPAAVHDLNGSWDHDPQRRRVEPQGEGELSRTPPACLDGLPGAGAAWLWILDRIPPVLRSGSDEIAVSRFAVLLGRAMTSDEFTSSDESLLKSYITAFGMSPEARAKLGTPIKKDPPKVDPLAKFRSRVAKAEGRSVGAN